MSLTSNSCLGVSHVKLSLFLYRGLVWSFECHLGYANHLSNLWVFIRKGAGWIVELNYYSWRPVSQGVASTRPNGLRQRTSGGYWSFPQGLCLLHLQYSIKQSYILLTPLTSVDLEKCTFALGCFVGPWKVVWWHQMRYLLLRHWLFSCGHCHFS